MVIKPTLTVRILSRARRWPCVHLGLVAKSSPTVNGLLFFCYYCCSCCLLLKSVEDVKMCLSNAMSRRLDCPSPEIKCIWRVETWCRDFPPKTVTDCLSQRECCCVAFPSLLQTHDRKANTGNCGWHMRKGVSFFVTLARRWYLVVERLHHEKGPQRSRQVWILVTILWPLRRHS